jgi:hypothetical protein
MREDASGDPVHINRMFGSSGLNLACEGLLLEMQNGARKGIPYGALPHA